MSQSRRNLTSAERASLVALTGVYFSDNREETASEESVSVYTQSSASRYSQSSEQAEAPALDAGGIGENQSSMLDDIYGDYFADERSIEQDKTSRIEEWAESVHNPTTADFEALGGANLDGEPSQSRWSADSEDIRLQSRWSLDSADRPPPRTRWSIDGDDFASFAESWSSAKKAAKQNFRKYVTDSNGVIDLAAGAKLSPAIDELLPKFDKNLSSKLRRIASNFIITTNEEYSTVIDVVEKYRSILTTFREFGYGSEGLYQELDKILYEIGQACVRSQGNEP